MPTARARPRIVKPAEVRRAELIDCAQRLFLERGYERTTINDVIEAAGVSKGAFYHHFDAKEDLLEAIAGRFADQALARAEAVFAEPALDVLQRLNSWMAISRDWKAENISGLKALFTVLLAPGNALLYHRIVGAVFAAMSPTLVRLIGDGARAGAFAVDDAGLAADMLLWLGENRRSLVVEALALAETGEVAAAADRIMRRLGAEEAIIGRVLGLPLGAVRLAGSDEELRALLTAWTSETRDAPALQSRSSTA